MEMDGKNGMRAMAIIVYEASRSNKGMLKLPLKGGGFPLPHWRQ